MSLSDREQAEGFRSVAVKAIAKPEEATWYGERRSHLVRRVYFRRAPDSPIMDGADLAREYYRAIDDGDYGALVDALGGGFVHRRPDTTIEGREEFVSFMRSGRPETDTSHELDAVLENDTGDRVAVEGRLLRADGSVWFRFVDVFTVRGGRIRALTTYTH